MTITIRDLPRLVSVTVVPGGAAGAHRVDGNITTGDVLLSVRRVSDTMSVNADLTAQFTIAGEGLLDNAGGTVTTGDWLVITYAKAEGT